MPCAAVQHRFVDPCADREDPLSWNNLAGVVRNRARVLAGDEGEDLLFYADLLEAQAELQRVPSVIFEPAAS